jgi:hypothetical protein
MEIFDFINNILFFKKNDIELNCEEYKKYNSYLINRWISMHSSDNAMIVNQTVNRRNFLCKESDSQYKFLLNVIPRSKYKKIEYIKKNTNEDKA